MSALREALCRVERIVRRSPLLLPLFLLAGCGGSDVAPLLRVGSRVEVAPGTDFSGTVTPLTGIAQALAGSGGAIEATLVSGGRTIVVRYPGNTPDGATLAIGAGSPGLSVSYAEAGGTGGSRWLATAGAVAIGSARRPFVTLTGVTLSPATGLPDNAAKGRLTLDGRLADNQ